MNEIDVLLILIDKNELKLLFWDIFKPFWLKVISVQNHM